MNGKHTACVNDLVRQVALMMDDCEQHAMCGRPECVAAILSAADDEVKNG